MKTTEAEKQTTQDLVNNLPSDISFKTLIEWGAKGYLPIFHEEWISEFQVKDLSGPLSSTQKHIVNKIIERLSKHRGIHRKRTILMSLAVDEREVFLRGFFKKVETQILNEMPELH